MSICILSHWISLVFAALIFIILPSFVIEPIIAASITCIGLENCFFLLKISHRGILSSAFGILQGLTFACILTSIMTLHASKGLEFTSVFLPGWEDGLFPSQRSLDEKGIIGLEEERRLAYVGITRAEKHCTISFASNRRIYNQWQSAIPSRFIDDLSKSDVEVITPPALYGGNYGAAVPRFSETPSNQFVYKGQSPGELGAPSASNRYNSLGWHRMKTHLQSKKVDSDSTIGSTGNTAYNLEVNEKVFHQKFGYGYVIKIDGDTIDVSFDKSGEKKVRSNYLLTKDNIP